MCCDGDVIPAKRCSCALKGGRSGGSCCLQLLAREFPVEVVLGNVLREDVSILDLAQGWLLLRDSFHAMSLLWGCVIWCGDFLGR